MPVHGEVGYAAKFPEVLLIHRNAHQVRHHVCKAAVVVSLYPDDFDAALGIRKLADVGEELPVIFLEACKIKVAEDVTEQNEAPEADGFQHSQRLLRSAHLRSEVNVGQKDGIEVGRSVLHTCWAIGVKP